MKEVTLKIPEKKLDFFMELMEQLGFEISHPIEISEEGRQIVQARITKSKHEPERILDWERVKDDFNFE